MEKGGLTLEEYVALQVAEMTSDLNRLGAKYALGHEASEDELAHYTCFMSESVFCS